MTLRILLVLILSFSLSASGVYSQNPHEDTVRSLIAEISQGEAFTNLSELVALGPRLTGSDQTQQALLWAEGKMRSYGLESITLQEVTVPHWVRGAPEQATLLYSNGTEASLRVAALGGSIGTPAGGVEAPVLEVKSLDEVDQRASEIRGKIVFYNRPLDPNEPDKFAAYSRASDQRTSGPARAARYGAVAVLIRSLSTLPDDDHPHTGITLFGRATKPIPAAALSTHAANILSQALKTALLNKETLRLRLELHCQNLPQVKSANLIAEIKGSVLPEEYVLVGGHLDSWDLGSGAHDDGAGVVQALEVLRAIKALGIHPKRTLRVVFFMAEEFGGMGANQYLREAQARGTQKERPIAAIEADRGGFEPQGFTIDGSTAAFKRIQSWKSLLQLAGAGQLEKGFSGNDVDGLKSLGAITLGYVPVSTHYFDLHHSALDQLSAVEPGALKKGAAAMAVMAYLIAEQGFGPQ